MPRGLMIFENEKETLNERGSGAAISDETTKVIKPA